MDSRKIKRKNSLNEEVLQGSQVIGLFVSRKDLGITNVQRKETHPRFPN
jgi:hypothetical protein